MISSFGQHLIVLVGFVGSHTWKIGKLPLPLNTYVEARVVEGAWNCYLNWVLFTHSSRLILRSPYRWRD